MVSGDFSHRRQRIPREGWGAWQQEANSSRSALVTASFRHQLATLHLTRSGQDVKLLL
jgi:hypothetical protein